MKKIIQLLFIFILVSCTQDVNTPVCELTVSDTAGLSLYKHLSNKVSKLKNDLRVSGVINNTLSSEINNLQYDVIRYQNNTIQLKVLEKKMTAFTDNNSVMLLKIETLSDINTKLRDSNTVIKMNLAVEKIKNKKLDEENALLKQPGITVTDVQVKGYYHKTSPFKTPRLRIEESFRAKNVEYIEVSFVVSDLKDVFGSITVKLYKADNEQKGAINELPISYSGKNIKLITNFYKCYQKGIYKTDIIIHNKTIYTTQIELL